MTSPVSPSGVAADAASSSVLSYDLLTHENVWDYLHPIKAFYRQTEGAQKLLVRSKHAHADVQHERACAAVAFNQAGPIAASALLYRHAKDLTEIGSVLVTPGHQNKGIYPILRGMLIGQAVGTTVTLFERLPNADPVLHDYLYAQRLAQGWTPMHHEEETWRRVEKTKLGMPPSSGGKPPRTGFKMAVTGTHLALASLHGADCTPFRNPAFTLGR